MAVTKGHARTANASKYLQQLCKHWSHKFEVEVSPAKGQVRFPSGIATLEATPEALLVMIETGDGGAIEAFKEVVARHLDRFAFREAPLPFTWSVTDDR